MFSSFSFHAETSPFWRDAFFTHTTLIVQDFQPNKCRKSLSENSSKFFRSHLVYMRMTIFCHSSPFPPLSFSSWHRLSRKNIFHPREHAISESFSLHNDVEVFCFRSLRCRRIINGRKLRKLCNIFIKFFVVACNFYEMEKFPCCVMLRMEPKKNRN